MMRMTRLRVFEAFTEIAMTIDFLIDLIRGPRKTKQKTPLDLLREERANLCANMRATEHQIDRYRRKWMDDGGHCCIDCMFSHDAVFRNLRDRQGRQAERLSVLNQKIAVLYGV